MKTRSILIIEDNTEMQFLLKLILEQEGYSVIAASTGEEALTILKSRPRLFLILMDLTLPDMLGQTLVGKIKCEQLIQKTPILFFSAVAGLTRMSLPDGVVGSIQKPFQVNDFLSKIKVFKNQASVSHIA